MAKKEEEQGDVTVNEQLDLIDVQPENVKPNLVKEAGLQRLEDGVIRFTHDNVTICITPQDEKVTVKDENESE